MSQPVVSYETAPWQVRIRREPKGLPVGGGMLCPDGHVVTCAHVVSKGTGRPAGPVYVEFQHADQHDPIQAFVVEGGWHPAAGEGGERGDVAVLRLTATAPSSAVPAPLRPAPENVDKPHSFHAYGYPIPHDRGGVPARGRIIGHAEMEWLSLLADHDGQELDPGFSGSPVWDVELRGVVGIVVLRDVPRSSGDRGGTKGPRNAYAIRMEALGGYWPALQPKVVRSLPADSESLEDLLEVARPAGGGLPTVAETSVYDMGVTRSKYVSADNPAPTYVPRTWVDAQIQDLLSAGERFIVAVGDSKSGKSRSMAEMLHRLRPNARLIVPDASDPAALSKLAQRSLPLGADGGVLWLDDIDRYLVLNGLDRKVLRSFLEREPQITVAGTITSRRYQDITAARQAAETRDVTTIRDATAQFGQVLAQAKLVRVASKPSPEDLAAARELYPGEDFQERGIGEQMVAASKVETKYDAAREASPEGWAVLQAAVDWRRIGVSGPVSQQTLRSLFQSYLSKVAPNLIPDDELFARGLSWAIEPLAGTIALLTMVEPTEERATYRAFDYVLACADGQGPFEPFPIARGAWNEAIASLAADELLVVTQAAILRGEPDIARRAAEAARDDSEDPAAVARATLFLGELHATGTEMDTAIKLLEEAAASGITDVVPNAQADLGAILALPGGDPDRARALLESAISAGDSQVVAQAQLNLGVMLMNRGDTPGARPLLEAAMAAHADLADAPFVGLSRQGVAERTQLPRKETRVVRHLAESAPAPSRATDDRSRVLQAAAVRQAESVHLRAQASLGGLLVNEGDLKQARMLLDAALDSNNPEVEPLARTNLGALLLRNGEVQAAEEQFKLVVDSGDAGVVPFAQISLGGLLAARDDREGGYALLESVAASGHPDQSPRALCLLGELHLGDGEMQEASSYLQRAVQTDHPEWAPYATVSIGLIRVQENDTDGARELLESVIASKHPSEGARAASLLGDILLDADNPDGAEDAYRRAISFGHPWWSALATIDLAGLRVQQGVPGDAAELLRSVVDGGDPNAAPMAGDILGNLLRLHMRDIDGAKAAYRQAIDSEHPDWSVEARFDLAELLDAEGDEDGAGEQLRQIAEGPNPIYAAKAWDLLGDLWDDSGDTAKARAAYQRAIDTDAQDWSAAARVDLARLILSESEVPTEADVTEAESLLTAAVADGPPHIVASARLLLGMIAMYGEDHDRAREEFRRAADTGLEQVAGPALMQIAKMALDDGELNEAADILEILTDGRLTDKGLELYAAVHLGIVRLRQGDHMAALPLLQRGVNSDDPDTAAYAQLYLGTALFDLDNVETADEILTVALRNGQPEVIDRVRAILGMVRLAQGRLEEAETLLTTALDGGDKEDEPKIRRYLGSVLDRLGREDEARAMLEPLVASSDTEHRPAGLLLLGRLAARDKSVAVSKRWFTAAIEADDPEVEVVARLELGRLLADSGDLNGSRQALTPLLEHALTSLLEDGDAIRAQAEEMLGELHAAENRAPPALAPSPPDVPAVPAVLDLPAKPDDQAATVKQTPAKEPAPPATAARAGRLEPLPPAVLTALADLAEYEEQLAEAEYWRSVRDGA